MKLSRRKQIVVPLAALSAALVAALGLTGCGGSTAAPQTPTAAASNTASASSSTQTPTTSARPTPHQTEDNPPGDIPDQQVFVAYTPPKAHFSIKVPEGWARSTTATGVRFTDKLNAITVQEVPAGAATSEAVASSTVVPRLAGQVPAFAAGKVSTVTRRAGRAVLVTYLGDSAPDPVTDKVVRDAFERYTFFHAGHEAVLTLSGPKGADNVDPWKIVSDSLRWQ
jgi:hypothetical protein